MSLLAWVGSFPLPCDAVIRLFCRLVLCLLARLLDENVWIRGLRDDEPISPDLWHILPPAPLFDWRLVLLNFFCVDLRVMAICCCCCFESIFLLAIEGDDRPLLCSFEEAGGLRCCLREGPPWGVCTAEFLVIPRLSNSIYWLLVAKCFALLVS